jgi:hypothetical protein
MKNSTSWFLFGGGTIVIGGVLLAWRRSVKTTDAVEKAISGEPVSPPPAPGEPDTRGKVKIRATGYWPYSAREDEKKMEGGTNDRLGHPIITLEQHLSNPTRYPYVSVSGDDAIWPAGQRISIDAWPSAVFRVVDTGSHFRGAGKIIRVTGYEPLDIAVNSSKTTVPKLVIATIYPGDNFGKGKLASVAVDKFKDQNVIVGGTVIGGDIQEGRTTPDIEALARAIESELGGQTQAEQTAAAWAMRNRAADTGVTLSQLLVPRGVYGPARVTGGYASTRKPSTPGSREIAEKVLDADQKADPTGRAIDFWTPHLQKQLHELAGVYVAAVRLGDMIRAKKYERFAGYGSELDVREQQAHDGLCVTRVVGAVELLGRMT